MAQPPLEGPWMGFAYHIINSRYAVRLDSELVFYLGAEETKSSGMHRSEPRSRTGFKRGRWKGGWCCEAEVAGVGCLDSLCLCSLQLTSLLYAPQHPNA